MTLADQITSDLNIFFNTDDFAETVEFKAAAYPQNLTVTALLTDVQPEGEVVADYAATRRADA